MSHAAHRHPARLSGAGGLALDHLPAPAACEIHHYFDLANIMR